jgi:hypothetical protein
MNTDCVGFDRVELDAMCYRDFAETINRSWKVRKDLAGQQIPSLPFQRTFKTRDVNSGYWELKKARKRRHIRWSTVLYTEPAHLYEEVALGITTSQTVYSNLPKAKQQQLYRAYEELVCYVPWTVSPDETFLPQDLREQLQDPEFDPEHDNM